MERIVVFDYTDRYGIATAEMAGYVKAGTAKSKEDILVGLETFAETVLKVLDGENFGNWFLAAAAA